MSKDTQMLVEVCCNSLESALNAEKGGADRIELCSELGVGGITPSHGLIKLVKENLAIPVYVLIRPRSAHFTYKQTEFEVMKADIEFCKSIEIDGIVSGALKSDATLDMTLTKALAELSKPLRFTFHRAFDWILNPEIALKQLEDLGVDTVLTSGQYLRAENGLENLEKWQLQTQMTIMAGSGVNSKNALQFKKAGLRAIHLSGTMFQNEVSVDRMVPMNSQNHLEECHVAVTNQALVRQIVQAVK